MIEFFENISYLLYLVVKYILTLVFWSIFGAGSVLLSFLFVTYLMSFLGF